MAKKKEDLEEKANESKEVKQLEELNEETLIEKPTEGLATELGEVKEIEEEVVEGVKKRGTFEKELWKPKTSLGMK
ncbi:hypothetical protein HYW99_04375, partial [Candidatus Woesearchaeota archaeon]|nr:hypothetical protein [Candidatus Woesearchaeota archaeon]